MKIFTLWLATTLFTGIHQGFSYPPKDTSALSNGIGTTSDRINRLPSKYLTTLNEKSAKMEHILNRQSDKALSRLSRMEQKIKRRLQGKADPELLSLLSDSSYKGFTISSLPVKGLADNLYLDSLQATFHFLGENQNLLSHSRKELTKAIKSLDVLRGELQRAKEIKSFIAGRRKLFQEHLSGYSDIQKYLTKYNKEAYYYSARVREYKSLLADRSKIEARAQEVLARLPAYKEFIKRNSMLSSLFNLPSGSSAAVRSLEGLQTRTLVESLIQRRLGSGSVAVQVMQQQMLAVQNPINSQLSIPEVTNVRNAVSNQIASARGSLSELQQTFPDLDNAAEMPVFKSSPMKAKRLWQRLEWGGNIQLQRSTNYFPATSDLAAQAAYRFHKNGSVGVGVGYKLGLGSDWSHIRFSHSGVSLRSFADWRLKDMYYLNGGFELNRLSIQAETTGTVAWHGWQSSALVGISRKYKINSRLKGNIMVLYDFLAAFHVPRSSGLKVRFGYSL